MFRVCQPVRGDGDFENSGCGLRQPKVYRKGLTIFLEFYDEQSMKFLNLANKNNNDKKGRLLPEEALRILSRISKEDQFLLGIKRPENMIIDVLAVGPPPMRPSVMMPGNG